MYMVYFIINLNLIFPVWKSSGFLLGRKKEKQGGGGGTFYLSKELTPVNFKHMSKELTPVS